MNENKYSNENEDFLNLQLKKSSNGILIANPMGKIEYVNDSFLEILEIPIETVINKDIFNDIFFLSPEIKKDLHLILKKENIWKGEVNYEIEEDNKKILSITLVGIKNISYNLINYLELVEDISSKKNTFLQNSEILDIDILKSAINNNPNGILIADEFVKIEYINETFL